MTGEEDSGLKKVSEKGNTEVGSVMPTWLNRHHSVQAKEQM